MLLMLSMPSTNRTVPDIVQVPPGLYFAGNWQVPGWEALGTGGDSDPCASFYASVKMVLIKLYISKSK